MPVDANEAMLSSWELSLHNKRPLTVRHYVKEMQRFARWLADADRPCGTYLLSVTRRDAEAYIADMQQRGLSKATIRTRWIAMRSFYGWCVSEEELEVSPVAKVNVERSTPPPVPLIALDDVKALLKACAGREFIDRRDLAIIRLMLATGMRLAEITKLRVDDVDLKARVAVVADGKGGYKRFAKFDAATAAAIDSYKRIRPRHRHADSHALWIGPKGPLGRTGIPGIIDRRAAMAGLGHIHAHRLRHTWADLCKRNGMSDEDLMNLGGWRDASVMARYGSARATDRALAAYDTIDPMGDL